MLSLMNRAFEPSVPNADRISFLTSLHHVQSVHSDNGTVTAEKIQDLLCSANSKLYGLQLLEIALQQNPDIYTKGRWTFMLIEIIKASKSVILKTHACRIIGMIIPYMVKDPTCTKIDLNRFAESLLFYLLSGLVDDCEWFKEACKAICLCAKHFPQAVKKSANTLNEIITKYITTSTSSKSIELIAEIYSELPNCIPNADPASYEENWLYHYKKVFYTMQKILDKFLTFLSDDPYADSEDAASLNGDYMFAHEQPDKDLYTEYTKGVRRYVNLCMCLSKMLSSKTRFPVVVPTHLTIRGLSRLFQAQDINKIKPTSMEMQIVCSYLSQMQIGNLQILESLMLNVPLDRRSMLVAQLCDSALQSSTLPNISSEAIYQLRLAVYVLMNKWITQDGFAACHDLLHPQIMLLDEMLKDISVNDRESSQSCANQTSAKSKKNISWINKCYTNPLQRNTCKTALKVMENLVYTAGTIISKKVFQEMFTKVSEIAKSLVECFGSYPFPYDDDSCRKNLYNVLLALTVNSKPNQRELIKIFQTASTKDSSLKVTRLCHKAIAICRLSMHPQRPTVELRETGRQNQCSELPIFPAWRPEQEYVQNIPVESASNVPSESTNCRITRTFHNPDEEAVEEDDEPMEEDAEESHYTEHVYSEYSEQQYMGKYSEEVSSSQRNGEDILEVHSSECQEDVDSEEEDEEDEEEEERSFGDEEINEEDVLTENIVIPGTSKLQIGTPVHNPETVAINLDEPELEAVKQCAKPESSVECNKSKQLNGIRTVVPDEDVPSTSRQCLANENGIENSEEEDLEDEENEEEEGETGSFPGEKRLPEAYASSPPSKKQRLEIDEEKENSNEEETQKGTLTLEEMKKDFVCDLQIEEETTS